MPLYCGRCSLCLSESDVGLRLRGTLKLGLLPFFRSIYLGPSAPHPSHQQLRPPTFASLTCSSHQLRVQRVLSHRILRVSPVPPPASSSYSSTIGHPQSLTMAPIQECGLHKTLCLENQFADLSVQPSSRTLKLRYISSKLALPSWREARVRRIAR